MCCRVRAVLWICLPILLMVDADRADAQIVRRFPGGGIAIRAPYVNIDIGRGARPLPPGAVYGGTRRRILRRQARLDEQAAQAAAAAPRSYGQVQVKQPTPAEAPPLPSRGELGELAMPELVSALRDLSRTFHEALGRFEDPAGWQQYLVIPEDALGTPGVSKVALDKEALEKQLARFEKVAVGNDFRKIARIPSFAATHTALELVLDRYEAVDSKVVTSSYEAEIAESGPSLDTSDLEAGSIEELPVPASPEPRKGERSILKRR